MAIMKKTPFQMDQARMEGIRSVLPRPRPPMVPTNTPSSTRNIGAARPPMRRTPFQNVQMSTAQSMTNPFQQQQQPGGGLRGMIGMIGGQVPNLRAPQPGAIATGPGGVPSTPTGDAVEGSGVEDLAPVDPAKAPGAPAEAKTPQELRDEAIANLFGKGPRDTADEEALIREQMENATGQALVNSRARMGRAGFGSSGAEAALSQDAMRAAREQGLQDVFGAREQARIDYRNDVNSAFNAEHQASEDEFTNWLREQLIKQGFGDDAPPNDGGGFPGLPNVDFMQLVGQDLGKGADQTELAAAQDPQDPNLPRKDAPGPNDDVVYSDGLPGTPGHYVVYRDAATGTLYRVGG